MNHFDPEWDNILKVEGREYSNDPLDSGGPTKFGITETTAREDDYTGPMEDLPEERAKRIAKKKYWDILSLDVIAEMSSGIAHELFDTGYNAGPNRAATYLQRCLNALNRSYLDTPDYPELKADGKLGARTIGALRSFLHKRGVDGQKVMLRLLNGLQAAGYVKLTERREKDEKFLFGWTLHRVVM